MTKSSSVPLADGPRAAALAELRRRLAAAIDVCEPRELSALSKQLRETIAELESLPLAERESKSDELARRRADRRSAAASAAPPADGGVKRRGRGGRAG